MMRQPGQRSVFAAAWLVAAIGCSSHDGQPAPTKSHDGGHAPAQRADAATSCDCAEPAVCAQEGKPRCVCPSGYVDTLGDGSQCDDIDECGDDRRECDVHARCSNDAGGYRCDCKAPAYVGDGRSCDCADGYRRTREGLCLANDGVACGDNLDCLNNHCEGGTCCARQCNAPDDCRTTEGATCEDGQTCVYPVEPDGTICDDSKACSATSTCQDGACTSGEPLSCEDNNPCTDDSCEEPFGCLNKNNSASCDDADRCTQNDRCSAGTCAGQAKDCASQGDACNTGSCDPKSGACKKSARSGELGCDDANSCTATDRCSDGTCLGKDDACGPNAISCSAGVPNQCTCKPDYVASAGRCVPMTDECAMASVCSPNADCFDPSNASGDVTCTCRNGYGGDGATCTQLDPCSGNPCGEGRGTCQASATAGAHSCTCNAGYVAVAGNCVCNLSGVFAARMRLQVSWMKTDDGLEGGKDMMDAYALQRQSYDASGNLTLEVQSCGDTGLDLCGVGVVPLLAAESYAQFLPVHIWDLPSMPRISAQLSLPAPLPGSPFVSQNFTFLTGISLTDPSGAWPASRGDIVGAPVFDGTATNGAAWRDHDGDSLIGVTRYVVPPGGIKRDGTIPDPPRDFGVTSSVCPRDGGAHTPYAYWPAVRDSLVIAPIRIKRFYVAARAISAYHGTVASCDEIAGDLTGPDNGKMSVDARIGGCVRTNGSAETACSDSAVDLFDQASPRRSIDSATFKLRRLPSGVTESCATVQALDFD